jgi:glucose/arabinose dehydrogenase
MKIWTGLVAGVALVSLGSALSAQNAPASAPGAAPAARPAPRPAGFPQAQPLGDGPWDMQTWEAKLHVEVVTKGLDHPWGMAFLPDGDILVTERPGRLRVIRNGVLDPKPIEGLPAIYATGIAGLTDVVLDPDFASNRLIYLAYSKAAPDTPPGTNPAQTEATLAVLRAKWDGGATLTEVKDIFVADAWYGKPPLPPKCCGQGPASGSFGGRLAIDNEGHLFITSGDRNFGEKVQDPSNHFGKILRINLDGSIPKDNPFTALTGFRHEIWSTGHRNQLGLFFDAPTGQLWETEFGPRGGDEVNLITRGGNYGWIDVTQGRHYNSEPARKGTRGVEGFIDPVWAFQPSGNPGNVAVYRGSAFSAWQGNLLVPNMGRPASLVRMVLSPEGHVVATEQMLGDLGQRLRDVRVAPDGSIYLLTDETAGAVLRITSGS